MCFERSAKWRAETFTGRRRQKRALVVRVLTEDASRCSNGLLKLNYNLPREATTSKLSETSCAAAFGLVYGMSSSTRVTCGKIVLNRGAVMDEEISELKTAVGEGRRHNTLLWFRDEFSLLCDFLPTSDYTNKDHHLPKCVSKTSLYNEYFVQFIEAFEVYGNEHKPYSYSMWLNLWKLEFPYVTIPTCFAFSVCETCAILHDRILFATKSVDKSALKELKEIRRTHLCFISKERLHYRHNQKLAREQPEKYISLCIDGMDQAKLRSPHFAGGGIPKGLYIDTNVKIIFISLAFRFFGLVLYFAPCSTWCTLPTA